MPNEEFRQTLRRLGIQETEKLRRYRQNEQWLLKQQQTIYLKIDSLKTVMTRVTGDGPLDSTDPEVESLLAAFQRKVRLLHDQYHCVYAERQHVQRKRIEEERRLTSQL